MLIRLVISIFVFTVFIFGGSPAMGGDIVIDARFWGEWVPAKAPCTSKLRLKLESNLVTFINGADHQEYSKLEQCYGCMGKEVEGFVWLTTDAMGDSPFTIFLDGTKKKIALSVDFFNDKKLGKRFPFGKAELKKCK